MQRIGETAGSRGWRAFGVSDHDEGMRLTLRHIQSIPLGIQEAEGRQAEAALSRDAAATF